MSDTPTPDASRRRDKLLPIAFWLALLALLFRPVFVSDFRALGESADRAAALWRLGADLQTFLILGISLVLILAGRIGSIAYNTFREAVRNRVLYFILFFALLLMGSARIVKELAIGAEDRIIANLGLGSISAFGTMVAVFAGISLVYNELEKKTIYTIVSKPVRRYQFLLGKFFGLLMTVFVIVAIMSLFFFAVVNFEAMTSDDAIYEALTVQQDGRRVVVDNPGLAKIAFMAKSLGLSVGKAFGNALGFYAPPGDPGVGVNLVIPIAMILVELMIVVAFAILFSSFSTPTLSAVLTVMVFLAGRLNEDIMRLAQRIVQNALKDSGAANVSELPAAVMAKVHLVEAVAVLVPNLDSINVSNQAIHRETFQVWRFSVLYGICYTGCVLMLSILIFNRRNFK